MVKCPYKDICTGYPHKCKDCAHNEERDYFKPRNPWRWKQDRIPPYRTEPRLKPYAEQDDFVGFTRLSNKYSDSVTKA